MKPIPLSKAKNLNKYQRLQTRLKFSNLFPKPRKKGKCRCGCRKKVKAPRRLWATVSCSDSASEYYFLIKGYHSTVRSLVYKRDRGKCAACHVTCGYRAWDADHILEVVNGGGGCDLTNYQTLCKPCHAVKTAKLYIKK